MFRRTGSVACFAVEGSMPAPTDAAFGAALARERFHSIETAAAEESSIGWVSPGDPTGDSFETEDMDADGAWWLRVRADKKSLPAPWVAIYRSSAERSRGRPLTRRELRELKEDLERKLLPKILPTVRLIDALYVPAASRVLLFAAGKGVHEEFAKLFHRTFNTLLIAATPRTVAQSLPLGRELHAYLDEVSPVAWHRSGAAPRRVVPAERRTGVDRAALDRADRELGPIERRDLEPEAAELVNGGEA